MLQDGTTVGARFFGRVPDTSARFLHVHRGESTGVQPGELTGCTIVYHRCIIVYHRCIIVYHRCIIVYHRCIIVLQNDTKMLQNDTQRVLAS